MQDRDFGKNDGSSIWMLYTGGGKGRWGRVEVLGGDKCKRDLLHFLERLRLLGTYGPVGNSVPYFILFQVFHILLGDHKITGSRLNNSKLGNSQLTRITRQSENTRQSDNTARIAPSDNTRQSDNTARIARQSENTQQSDNTCQSANQRSWRDVAAKPMTICAN